MRAAVKMWTAQETELAQTLMNQDADDATFMSVLGRTKKCAESKLRRHNDHLFGNVMKIGHYAGEARVHIPPEVIEDRNRRLMARQLMSPAARIMGDPPAGFSALAQKELAA